eukprot:1157716-Pelagomonas_calceolata.AAC.7
MWAGERKAGLLLRSCLDACTCCLDAHMCCSLLTAVPVFNPYVATLAIQIAARKDTAVTMSQAPGRQLLLHSPYAFLVMVVHADYPNSSFEDVQHCRKRVP